MKQKTPTIGCAVITHCAKKHLPHCLPPFLKSPLKPRVVVVNSSSNDGTVELAESLGAETLIIPRSEFNHGATREKARKYLGTDIVVMLTPDAYALDEHVLEKLVVPLILGQASVSYARQIAHVGADFFESFPREFNYPDKGHIRSIADLHKYGVYTFFCSDSCAAYLNRALDEIGGFQHLLLGEDTVAVAKLLRQGHHVAYAADAIVRHSHRYTLKEEFMRSFDTGLARTGYGDLLQGGSDSKRGIEYLKTMIKKLTKENCFSIPYAFAHVTAKWLGYKVGKASVNAPVWFKKALSTQDFYWKNF